VAQILRDKGFRNAYALRGGFNAWAAAGYPLEEKTQAA
jgi:rhodanese-related sulfurtransferase